MFRIGRAQTAFNLAVEAIEWSGLRKDMRSDLTVNLQVHSEAYSGGLWGLTPPPGLVISMISNWFRASTKAELS